MRSLSLTALLAVAALSSASVVQSPVKDDTFELLILHNNDMHARFEQTSQFSGACTTTDREAGKCYGGFPRVAHVVKEARRAAASGKGPPVLYLNAGDTYTGTAWFTIYKWQIAAEFINALQPDAVSLGNHELDDGVSGLTPFIKNLSCPVLAANLILNKEPTLETEENLIKSVVFNVNGTKIGVIGYLTPETKVLAVRNNIEYIDEVIAIREEVEKLKYEGIKIFIALGHSGFTKDLEIAKEVEDIDLVIGGHTNTFLWNGITPDVETPEGPYPTIVKQASGRRVPAVQAYAYTKYLGKLHLEFDSNGELIRFDGNPLLLDNSVPQDQDVLDIVSRYRSGVMAVSEVVVGNTSIILDGDSCRLKECNIGNLITDAMVTQYALQYKGNGWTDAPIALVAGGGIRASIAHSNRPANITKGDLLIVMPFDGHLAKVTVNGSVIWQLFEHSVAMYNNIRAPGQFLQVSGIKVEYDFNKKPYKRVSKLLVRCGLCDIPVYTPVDKSATYYVLMPSFLLMGGDGFSMLDGLPALQLSYNELDATTEYVKSRSPVYPAVEERIIIHNAEKLTPNSAYSFSFSLTVCVFSLLTSVVV